MDTLLWSPGALILIIFMNIKIHIIRVQNVINCLAKFLL